MRRTIVTAALATALLVAAACSTTGTTEASSTPTPSSTASAEAAGATIGRAATCEAYVKLQTEMKLKMVAAMGTLLASMADPSKEEQAVKESKAVFTELQAGVEAQRTGAGDAELKAALSAYAAELTKTLDALNAAGTDVDKAMDAVDDDALTALEEKVNQLCL